MLLAVIYRNQVERFPKSLEINASLLRVKLLKIVLYFNKQNCAFQMLMAMCSKCVWESTQRFKKKKLENYRFCARVAILINFGPKVLILNFDKSFQVIYDYSHEWFPWFWTSSARASQILEDCSLYARGYDPQTLWG